MALIINDEILRKVQISEKDLLIDLACYLYDKKRLSLGQARQLADLDQITFQRELVKRDIDIHYTEKDLNDDLKNLNISL